MRQIIFIIGLLFLGPCIANPITVFYDPLQGTPTQLKFEAPIKLVGKERCAGTRRTHGITLAGFLSFDGFGVEHLEQRKVRNSTASDDPGVALLVPDYSTYFDLKSGVQNSNKKWTITRFGGGDQSGSKIKGVIRYNYRNSGTFSGTKPKYIAQPPPAVVYVVLRYEDTWSDLYGSVTLKNGSCTFNGAMSVNDGE